MLVAHSPARDAPPAAAAARPATRVAAAAGRWWPRRRCGSGAAPASARSTHRRRRLPATNRRRAALQLDPVADADLPRLAPLLDQARALPHGVGAADLAAGCGSGCRSATSSMPAARAVYRHALECALLPRLIWRLESAVARQSGPAGFPLRGDAGLSDARQRRVRSTGAGARLDEAGLAGRLSRSRLRRRCAMSLLRHLDALLAEPLPQMQLDGALVAEARAHLQPRCRWRSGSIRASVRPPRRSALPPWRPSDAFGAAGVPLFVRASGKPLTDGIPGFFTVDGFHKVLLPSLASAAKSVASRKLGAGQARRTRPERPQMRAPGTAMSSRSTRPTTRRPGTRCWPT